MRQNGPHANLFEDHLFEYKVKIPVIILRIILLKDLRRFWFKRKHKKKQRRKRNRTYCSWERVGQFYYSKMLIRFQRVITLSRFSEKDYDMMNAI